MKRPAVLLLLAMVLAACGSTNPSGTTSISSVSLPASPATSPAASTTQAPSIRDLALYPLPQANDLFRGAKIASIAGGRAGALILGTDAATGALVSWTSADGADWARHWLPGSTFGGGSPELLVGGDFGYVAAGWRIAGSTVSSALWTSADGIAWSAVADPDQPTGTIRTLVAGPAGVAAGLDVAGDLGAVAVSTDGRSWRGAQLPIGARLNPSDLVALPNGFLLDGILQADASGGTAARRSAWRSTDGLTWIEDKTLSTQFDALDNSIEGWTLSPFGAVAWDLTMKGIIRLTDAGLVHLPLPPGSYGHLVGGPVGLLWIEGSDLGGSCSAAWQYDGQSWQPLSGGGAGTACVDAAGPYILAAAALPDSIVIFGLLGHDYQRVAWLVRAPGRPPTGPVAGGPIPTAPATSIPDRLAATIDRPASCPTLPASVDAVIGLDPLAAVGCFGDHDLSFRAWVVDPGEVYGTCEAFSPTWIHECVLPDYLLAAEPGSGPGIHGIVGIHAMRSPSATGDLKGVGRWVEVTGHYDDPISPTCRYSSGDISIGFDPERPAALAVLECRQVFVLTHLRTVHAP